MLRVSGRMRVTEERCVSLLGQSESEPAVGSEQAVEEQRHNVSK